MMTVVDPRSVRLAYIHNRLFTPGCPTLEAAQLVAERAQLRRQLDEDLVPLLARCAPWSGGVFIQKEKAP